MIGVVSVCKTSLYGGMNGCDMLRDAFYVTS